MAISVARAPSGKGKELTQPSGDQVRSGQEEKEVSGNTAKQVTNAQRNKIRVAVITNVIPNYREDFFRRVFADDVTETTVFCQETIPGMNLEIVNGKFPNNVVEVRHWGLAKEKLSWQRLPVRRLWTKYDVCVFIGNPRVISTVLWATIFHLLRKPVVIWGQVHTAGAAGITTGIRLRWWRLFDYFFVYTDAEVAELKGHGFNEKTIVAMNNGLDQRVIEDAKSPWSSARLADWKQEKGLVDKVVLLSCSRLEPKNRLDLVIRALPELKSMYPNIVWCVVGDGVAKDELQTLGEQLGVTSEIRWIGALYDETQLAPWFLSANLFVHPGAIGLSLLHAFGYGVPVVTHNTRIHHMPEISALVDGENGKMFREGDAGDFTAVVKGLIDDREKREQLGCNALSCARERFNTAIMAQRFFTLLETVEAGVRR